MPIYRLRFRGELKDEPTSEGIAEVLERRDNLPKLMRAASDSEIIFDGGSDEDMKLLSELAFSESELKDFKTLTVTIDEVEAQVSGIDPTKTDYVWKRTVQHPKEFVGW